MYVKAAILVEAAILLLAIWHIKAAFILQTAILLLLISPAARFMAFLAEADMRVTYLEKRLNSMWWWKHDPELRKAIEAELLDELEGRTIAGERAGRPTSG